MKLAIVQMVFGALIVLLLLLLLLGIRPNFFPWFNVILVLGLAVLGCGIAQFLKARG